MRCQVLKSTSRDYTYLFVREDLEFDDLPDELRAAFGSPAKVLDLELSEQRPLAQEDVHTVMDNLRRQGYHLQLPPQEDPDGWLELPPS